jgi:hypothetical protein
MSVREVVIAKLRSYLAGAKWERFTAEEDTEVARMMAHGEPRSRFFRPDWRSLAIEAWSAPILSET